MGCRMLPVNGDVQYSNIDLLEKIQLYQFEVFTPRSVTFSISIYFSMSFPSISFLTIMKLIFCFIRAFCDGDYELRDGRGQLL